MLLLTEVKQEILLLSLPGLFLELLLCVSLVESVETSAVISSPLGTFIYITNPVLALPECGKSCFSEIGAI